MEQIRCGIDFKAAFSKVRRISLYGENRMSFLHIKWVQSFIG
ncbi:hypothetical protein [Succinimonas sp.]